MSITQTPTEYNIFPIGQKVRLNIALKYDNGLLIPEGTLATVIGYPGNDIQIELELNHGRVRVRVSPSCIKPA